MPRRTNWPTGLLKNAAASLNLMLKNLPVHFDDPAFREDALRGVGNTARRIDEMIARLSALRQRPDFKPVEADLNQLVSEALDRLDGMPHVELTKELQPLPRMLADREQIQSVVTNLVLNARDAWGREAAFACARSTPEAASFSLSTDNGCGMSAAFLKDSLFRPFQSTKKKGLGIGMFQSRMIVEAHGGSIQVESETGKGTTFRVSLPRQGREMTKTRLLIVDDDEDIRTQMKWALADDYEVLMAGDRAGAVAAFTADRPAVTLLDLGLPPRPNDPDEGLAALSALLVLDPLAKVIVVSGQGDKQNALRAVGAGAYDFLCKPVDMDELGARAAALRVRGGARAGIPRHAGERAGRRLRGHAGREPADAGRLRVRSQGGAHQRPGADSRRERHRQGNGGAGAPSPEPAERAARSSPSTATPSRRTCSRASCSATRRARSPARTRSARGTSRRPRGARSSSTRSASCRRRSR